MVFQKAWVMRASVFDISREKILSLGDHGGRGGLSLRDLVLPVLGWPAKRTVQPVILSSLIIWRITPAAMRVVVCPTMSSRRRSTPGRSPGQGHICGNACPHALCGSNCNSQSFNSAIVETKKTVGGRKRVMEFV